MRHGFLTLAFALALTLALPLALQAQEAPPDGAPPAPTAVDVVSPEAPAPVALPLTPSPSPEVAIPVPAAETMLIPVATVPAVVPVPIPVEPVDVSSGVGQIVEAYQTGGWLAAGAAAVMLLTLLLRIFGLLDRIPKRARVVVPLALGCVAALLAAVAGGLPWGQAAMVAFLTGPMAVGLHQGIARSLMGQDSPETAALKTAAGK